MFVWDESRYDENQCSNDTHLITNDVGSINLGPNLDLHHNATISHCLIPQYWLTFSLAIEIKNITYNGPTSVSRENWN